jgi:guanylate kinase
MTHSETATASTAPPAAVRGTLFVVAAPSGAGKSSLVNAVLAREPGISLSISFTTRGMRPGERHAQHYHFISRDEFERMVAAGDFFEHALVHGDYKGTARQSVEPQLAAGQDVLLEIDWQGARQVRAKVPDAVSVFILPPSRAALEDRMRKRGQDSEAVIAQRLANAREEMSHCGEFDFVIVNEDFETATCEMHAIFTACRLRQGIQARRHADLLKTLLSGS